MLLLEGACRFTFGMGAQGTLSPICVVGKQRVTRFDSNSDSGHIFIQTQHIKLLLYAGPLTSFACWSVKCDTFGLLTAPRSEYLSGNEGFTLQKLHGATEGYAAISVPSLEASQQLATTYI